MRRVLRETGNLPAVRLYSQSSSENASRQDIWQKELHKCCLVLYGPGNKIETFPRKHIYWYAKGKTWTFNDAVRVPQTRNSPMFGSNNMTDEMMDEYEKNGKMPESWWTETNSVGMTTVGRLLNENLGYPTQKPVALMNDNQSIIE